MQRVALLLEQVHGHGQPDREGQEGRGQRRGHRGLSLRPAHEAHAATEGPRAHGFVGTQAAQVLGEVRRARVATLAILVERGAEHEHQVPGQGAVVRARVGDRVEKDLALELVLGGRLVQALAGQGLVQARAKGVDVRPSVEPVTRAAQLLRRHVRRRAEHLARAGDHRALVVRVAGQAEVEQHRRAVRSHEHVGRLDVAVHQSGLVG